MLRPVYTIFLSFSSHACTNIKIYSLWQGTWDLIAHLQSTTKEIHIHVRSIFLRFWNVTNFVNATSTENIQVLKFRTEQGFQQIHFHSDPWQDVLSCLQMQHGRFERLQRMMTELRLMTRNQNRKFVVSHKERTDITYACMNPGRRLYDIHDACSVAHCISRSVKPT